jgi:hypothetical protein
MKNSQPLSFAILVLLFFLISCTKQGPIGPAGATGATGAQGPTGPQGPSGNANVTSVTFDSISVPLNGTYTFKIPAITQAIVDSGVVDVYYKFAYTDQWVPLPYYSFYQSNLVWLVLEDIQLGQATLWDEGITSEPTTYRFDIIAAN